MDVEGARVLITGASSGIGAALARVMVGRGAPVGIVARRQDKLEAVLDECRATNPACRSWVADLGDLQAAEALALEAWDVFGGLDIIVHQAAVPQRRAASSLTAADAERAV